MLFNTTRFEFEVRRGMLFVRFGRRGLCLRRDAYGWMFDHDFG